MNIANHLLDKDFVLKYFKKKLLPLYPNFVDIKKIKIVFHKKMIWESTYHLVLEYRTVFLTKNNKAVVLPIFCSAHSNEDRLSFYKGLRLLWQSGFNGSHLVVPHPLFFSKYFNATFYRGLVGNHLHYFIKNNDLEIVEKIIPRIAFWLAKLHSIQPSNNITLSNPNSRIITVVPGVEKILKKISYNFKDLKKICRSIYKELIKRENAFFKKTNRLYLIHGDAHPENFIKIGHHKLGAIDFTDLCLADFARDLGSFLQQLDYMLGKRGINKKYINKIKKLFLSSYLKKTGLQKTSDFEKRINTYYNFTAMRTATYFLIREEPNREKAEKLLKIICKNLNIKYKSIVKDSFK